MDATIMFSRCVSFAFIFLEVRVLFGGVGACSTHATDISMAQNVR